MSWSSAWKNVKGITEFWRVPGSKFEKWREFRVPNKKSYELFPNFPDKHKHFQVLNGKLLYCFCEDSIFFSDKINLKVSEPLISLHKNFGENTHFFFPQTHLTYRIHI